MNSVILTAPPLISLFAGAAVLAADGRLFRQRRNVLPPLLSALCALTGIVWALVLEASLREILTALLPALLVSLLPPSGGRKEGGG